MYVNLMWSPLENGKYGRVKEVAAGKLDVHVFLHSVFSETLAAGTRCVCRGGGIIGDHSITSILHFTYVKALQFYPSN